MCDLICGFFVVVFFSSLIKLQDKISLPESTSEKLNKNPFLQIKTSAFLLPFKHLNTLYMMPKLSSQSYEVL